MNRLIRILSVCVLCACFTACQYFTREKDRQEIARVYDKYLLRAELMEVIPKGTSPEDSLVLAQRYIDSWVARQLMLRQAEENVSQENLAKELASYREMILRNRYEQAIISQRLDTTVTEGEIEEYYRQNKNGLNLFKDIIQIAYLPITYCEGSVLRELIQAAGRTSPAQWEEAVEKTIEKNNYNVNLYKTQWLELDNFLETYTVQPEFFTNLQKNNLQAFQFENQGDVYLGKIFSYRKKGETPPIEHVRDRIKSIILNNRKREILKEAEHSLMERALKKGKIKYYNQSTDE